MNASITFRNARRWLLVVAATFALLPGAHAAPDNRFEPAFEAFNRASAGDASAVDVAADAFGALLEAEPANPVLMAYTGAATAMKARTTMLPWKKMGYAEDGLALIDKALAMLRPNQDAALQHGTPGALETRFIAANTFLAVPDFMNRGARGAVLLNQVSSSPLLARAPLPFQGAVWMRAAALAAKEHRPEDARRWLNEVINQGAPQAAQARSQLAEQAGS